MRIVALVVLACGLGFTGFAGRLEGQPPAKGEAQKPQTLFATVRELMSDGKFDVAAGFLKLFLEANPTEADLLELERKHGSTVFLNLRNIPRWSDNAAVEKDARATVEEIIKRSQAANQKLLRDPARVAKYIRNLGATYEEKVFAQLELKRTGDYAIPFMVDEFRVTRDKGIYGGLLDTIPMLESPAIAGWVAALDGMTADQQFGVISAIAIRPDALNLQSFAQSDLSPVLWRILVQPEQSPALRALAGKLLNLLHPGLKSDTKLPEEQLTALARTFYDHSARYSGIRNNADGSARTVALWIWDDKTQKLVKLEEVPMGQAEEYFGLKYARWVLDAKPAYEPAQGLLIALAAERAIERARFGNLAKAEPGVFRLLSDAPSGVLIDQLSRGLDQKKTALALAMIQVLGDRADRNAATPPAGPGEKPSLLVKALGYPDPQVQFTAATALLRSPVPVPASARPLIVDILRRAAAADPGTSDGTLGTALIADPSKSRSDSIAVLLRSLGYRVEVMTNGRDLLRRIARASDFDLIMIDRHTANPELIDIVGQIQADTKTANRPTLVVASSDKMRMPTFDQLVVRFAALIGATENEAVGMEAPFRIEQVRDLTDPKKIDDDRRKNAESRDNTYRRVAETRIARLKRLIDATGLELTETQKVLLSLRIQMLTYAVLGLQFPYTESSAPDTVAVVAKLKRQLAAQPLSPLYGTGTPTMDLLKMMERFELDLDRVPARKKQFEELYSRLDPSEFGIVVETFREPALEARLQRTLRNYPSVKIIPEPFIRAELGTDLIASYGDPAQAPRDPAEKKAAQKAAVEWLRKMAIGETPGYDVKSTEADLRAALRVDDLAESAIDAVARFGTAAAQESLLSVAMSGMRPLPIRIKAADAVIQHIQINGPSIPKTLLQPLVELSGSEPNLTLRGKLLTLKGMLAYTQGDFVNQLKSYNPPLIPLPPGKPKEPVPPPEKQ